MNPIPGDLLAYLGGRRAYRRLGQAKILLQRPISTIVALSYPAALPYQRKSSRAAARVNNLGPELVAALLLAEQRDQSRNEDGKDYQAAISFKRANTSIGLGQVVISTAIRNDLFADLLSAGSRIALHHRQVASALASDELNIFAVARYARIVADQGARRHIATLPNTKASDPGHSNGIVPSQFARVARRQYPRLWDPNIPLGRGTISSRKGGVSSYWRPTKTSSRLGSSDVPGWTGRHCLFFDNYAGRLPPPECGQSGRPRRCHRGSRRDSRSSKRPRTDTAQGAIRSSRGSAPVSLAPGWRRAIARDRRRHRHISSCPFP